METLIVHPKDENQLAAIKAFMQALNIDFENQANTITDNLKRSIDKGINEADNGETISFEAFKLKHFKAG
ncbi:DUF2683 family protein [Pedobacter jamesrossensis]|uniref:DUF2683 family protein n=1 Tax=Pedobacter jamesrossensis TaxID=1908238 RepID=A0ABV8NH24_9SPHI